MSAGATGMAKKILVVEDDKVVRTLLVRLLEKNGFTVFEAEDGLFALKALEGQAFDLLLLDVMMPRLDGFKTLKAIRFMEKQAGRPHIPAIFLTAKSDARSMIEGINLGAKFFLNKPFTIEDVIGKIRRALNEAA